MPRIWKSGTEILFRGETTELAVAVNGESATVRFADQEFVLPEVRLDLRGAVEGYLRKLAERDLPRRTRTLGRANGIEPRRITIRNQSTRWGSCSAKGTISLNWRLIQVPPFVRDYIILHELMHLHELNHSPRFWRRVKQVCPDYEKAEHWLKHHWPRPA
jgi:predicted metal-dependent hydrolase